jgi:hypothetical protein
MADAVIREKLITYAQSLLKDPRLHQQGGTAVWETIKHAITPSFFSPDPLPHHVQQPVALHHPQSTTQRKPATAPPAASVAIVPVPAKKTSSPSPKQHVSSSSPINMSLPKGMSPLVIPPPIPPSNSMPPSELLKPIHLPNNNNDRHIAKATPHSGAPVTSSAPTSNTHHA